MANRTTRRGVGLAALLAPLGAVAAAAEPVSAASPQIRRLWVDLVAARAAFVAFEASPQPHREDFVARWGEIPRGMSGDEHWGHDPELPALIAAANESNRLVAIDSDCLDALLDYPGRSAADVACKLAAVLDIWRATGGLDDYHEQVAMKLMVDAERTLYDLLPPERLPIVA